MLADSPSLPTFNARRSLVGRLERILTGSLLAAIFVSLLIILSEETVDRERELQQQASSWLQTMAVQAESPMLFRDPTTTREMLEAAKGFPGLVGVMVETDAGERLGTWIREGEVEWSPSLQSPGWLGSLSSTLDLSVRVQLAGQNLGWLHGRFDRGPMRSKLLRFAAVLLLTLCAAGGLAVLITRRLLRQALVPVSALTAAVETVSANHEYSLRVPPAGEDEIGQLTQGFNNMLGQIESRDQRLSLQQVQLSELRDKADAANAAKSRFLASMSHEIRTPMNAVLGMTQLALQTPLTAEQRQYVSRAQQAGQHLLGLINDILDLSKIEAGQMALDPVCFAAQGLLDNLDNLIGQRARDKGLQLKLSISDVVPPYLLADELRLTQILANLAGNAVKFTDHGEVEVALDVLAQTGDEHCLAMWVKDTGMGMDDTQQARLFKAFQQAEGSIARRFGGTGLGLVICRELATLMHGQIGVESTPGQGTVFLVTAWVRSSDVAPLPKVASQITPVTNLQGMRVLLVEDHPDNQQVAVGLLQVAGVQVDVVDDGGAALDRLAVVGYDCVLLDLMMDGMDGYETLQAIRANPALSLQPVVVVSADATAEARQRCEILGVHAFLTKPIDARALYTVLGPFARVPQKPLSGLRILLADDEPMNQLIGCEILRGAGAEVVAADDGQEVLQRLQTEQFDLVLLDIYMPQLDGPETMRAIRADVSLPKMCVLAMSASDDLNDQQACLAAGMNGFVAKPVDVAEVAAHWARFRECQYVH